MGCAASSAGNIPQTYNWLEELNGPTKEVSMGMITEVNNTGHVYFRNSEWVTVESIGGFSIIPYFPRGKDVTVKYCA